MTGPVDAPALAALTRRLAECPAEFLLEPRTQAIAGPIEVEAVVNDLLVALGLAEGLPPDAAARYRAAPADARNLLRLTLVASWLCHDPSIAAQGRPERVRAWLLDALPPLSSLVAAERLVGDADRREELARSLLDALGVAPAGESPAQAADRLRALSTVERARVIEATRAQQARARALREKLAAEQARQAAARYSSE